MNKQTVRQINFNERIRRSDVTEPGLSILIPTAQPNQPRPKAVPVQVDNLSGVADQIRPGDFVDILGSFEIQRTIIRPGFGENNQIVLREEAITGRSVKTLIQNVQVLQILKPAAPQGTPGAEGGACPPWMIEVGARPHPARIDRMRLVRKNRPARIAVVRVSTFAVPRLVMKPPLEPMPSPPPSERCNSTAPIMASTSIR